MADTAIGAVAELVEHFNGDIAAMIAQTIEDSEPIRPIGAIDDMPDNDIVVTYDGLILRRDEVEALKSERCHCGHLYSLHTMHCCTYCNVDDCPCED